VIIEKKSLLYAGWYLSIAYFYAMFEFIIIVLVILAMAGFSMNKKK